jgi:hypothetical protein
MSYWEILWSFRTSIRFNNIFYLTEEKYAKWSEVKAVKVLSNKQSVHYRQLKPFDVLSIRGEEKLMMKFVTTSATKICLV